MDEKGHSRTPLNVYTQLEQLQSRYVGTGHADITRHEWLLTQHRDSLTTYLGHPNMLMHIGLVENESLARVRFNLLEKLIQPCGPPPKQEF